MCDDSIFSWVPLCRPTPKRMKALRTLLDREYRRHGIPEETLGAVDRYYRRTTDAPLASNVTYDEVIDTLLDVYEQLGEDNLSGVLKLPCMPYSIFVARQAVDGDMDDDCMFRACKLLSTLPRNALRKLTVWAIEDDRGEIIDLW